MGMKELTDIVIQLIASIISITMIVYTILYGKRNKLVKSYIAVHFLIVFWLVLQILQALGINNYIALFINRDRIFAVHITPIILSFVMQVLTITVFKYKLMDDLTGMLKYIICEVDGAVLVIDNYNTIVFHNNSFAKNFKHLFNGHNDEDIGVFLKGIRMSMKSISNTEEIFHAIEKGTVTSVYSDLEIIFDEVKNYQVIVQPIFNKKNSIVGRIVSFNDVSLLKNLLNDLNEKNVEISEKNEEISSMNEELLLVNEEMDKANKSLSEYAEKLEELAIADERSRISREIHDKLSCTLSEITVMLEKAKEVSLKEPDKVKEYIFQVSALSKNGLGEVRRSISSLTSNNSESSNLVESINDLVSEFLQRGIKVDFSVDGITNYRNPVFTDVVYRICQEALINSIKHGKAKKSIIILQFEQGIIKIYIFDDGIGCKEVNKGFGLSDIEQRVRKLKGDISFGSDGENGFNINVEIPIIDSLM